MLRHLMIFGLLGAASIAAAESTAYKVSVDTPSAKSTQRAVAKLHITPGAGYHFNQEFPTSVTVTPPAGVTVERNKQTAKDAVKLGEAGADFEIAFVAADKGKKEFVSDLKFAVCSSNTCDPKRESIHFIVDVK